MRGELHLEAIRERGPALVDTRFARAEVKIRDLLLALEILERDGFDLRRFAYPNNTKKHVNYSSIIDEAILRLF